MLFKRHLQELKNTNEFILLCNEQYEDYGEAYFKKIVTANNCLYNFDIMLSDDLIYLTIEMQKHNQGKEHLEIYDKSHINCVKPFVTVKQLTNFIHYFLNY